MPTIAVIAVTSRSRAGFRRLGRRFTREITEIPLVDLSEQDGLALRTDPHLVCEDIELEAEAVELADMRVDQLRALAESEEIDLSRVKRKDDIIATIEATREAKAEAERQAAEEESAAAKVAAGTGTDSSENQGEA